jgi:hypothetical protein
VVEVDGKVIGTGKPGCLWQQAQSLFSRHKYNV